VQDISDLRLKFALRPHHVCKYGRHLTCDGKKIEEEETTGRKYNVRICYAGRPYIKTLEL